MKGFVRELLITLGILVAVFFLLQTTIQHSIVDGTSMQPSLEDRQHLIVVKAAYSFSSPQRGNVVVIHPPVAPGRM